MKIFSWYIVFFSCLLFSCKSEVKQEKDITVNRVLEPQLYCDTLFSFTLDLLVKTGYNSFENEKLDFIGLISIKGSFIINELRELSDTSYFTEYPSLRIVYKRVQRDCSLTNIDTNCYSKFRFCNKNDIESWKKKRTEIQDSDVFVPPTYYSFSKPLLSSNSNYLIIELTKNCFGLCGYKSSYLFTKKEGNWKLLKSRLLWIS